MTIDGSKYLDSNNYRRIGINKNVSVKGFCNINDLVVSDRFSKSLKGKTEQEKKEEIIKYFIRNHDICYMHEDSKDITILSKSGVKLVINRNNTINKKVLKELLDNYEISRMNTYINTDVDYYMISSGPLMFNSVVRENEFFYETHDLPEMFYDLSFMNLVFQYTKDKISESDLNFFKIMLEDFEDLEFMMYDDIVWKNKLIYRFIKDDKEKYLIVNNYSNREVFNVIDNKINERKECKKLQLKMEGF